MRAIFIDGKFVTLASKRQFVVFWGALIPPVVDRMERSGLNDDDDDLIESGNPQ
jgi:hypothetical protein